MNLFIFDIRFSLSISDNYLKDMLSVVVYCLFVLYAAATNTNLPEGTMTMSL